MDTVVVCKRYIGCNVQQQHTVIKSYDEDTGEYKLVVLLVLATNDSGVPGGPLVFPVQYNLHGRLREDENGASQVEEVKATTTILAESLGRLQFDATTEIFVVWALGELRWSSQIMGVMFTHTENMHQ